MTRRSGEDRFGRIADELDAFRSDLARLAHLLTELETYRDHDSQLHDAEIGRILMRDRQSSLRNAVDRLAVRYPRVLSRLSFPDERQRWEEIADTVVSGRTVARDPHFDVHDDELREMHRQVARWSTLSTTHHVFVRHLRAAIRRRPRREVEVQNVAESVLIGSGVEAMREAPIVTRRLEVRKPDFYVKAVELAIELKHCASRARASRILDEVRADQSLYEDGRRLLFVIYDCGGIRDPIGYAADLEHAFAPAPRRSVAVEVIKD